jgi:NAD(P)-dependent dehydrogenase (short-subunit alcohol dehydrogenase family)
MKKCKEEAAMSGRLADKVAIVVGAGQTAGETIGNGRAISILFAREGAQVLLVDRRGDSARETQAMIEAEGGRAAVCEADITRAADCGRLVEECLAVFGRVDVLVYVCGIGDGDGGPVRLAEEAWDRIFAVNLKGLFLTCKHVLPVMERQQSGSIISLSSAAAVCSVSMLAYKTSKAGLNALTHAIAMKYAKHGIRVNAVMPGLLNTPMAVEGISRGLRIDRQKLIEARNAAVPLKGGMGTAWDAAYAVLFLASDEAKFITSAILPVDGGQSARIG